MIRALFILFSVLFFTSAATAQQEFIERENHYGNVIETNDPDSDEVGEISGFNITPVTWIPYKTKCKPCRNLTAQYNETMQDLLNARGMIYILEVEKDMLAARSPTAPTNQTDAQAATNLATIMSRNERLEETLPQLQRNFEQLKLTAKYLQRALAECELQCQPKTENKEPLIFVPGGTIIQDPALFIDWNGPYYEVCEDCRKITAKLNEFYNIAVKHVNVLNALESRVLYLKSQLQIAQNSAAIFRSEMEKQEEELADGTINGISRAKADQDKEEEKFHQDRLKDLQKQIKKAEKDLKDAQKKRDKIKSDFEKTLAKYNECIKKCPPQKNACVFPDELFSSMTIGPNDEVGSSAQAAKELRDKATGAVKGVATKALGSLLGFGGGGGGGGGPKMDRDRSRGDFTRISSGDTDLDIRASWRNDQLIVSTEIDDSPDNGTFHAQWIEDIDGNTYLPVRYMIFKMYRDWKLTVSWTEDHYVNGEHVFHDEGREVSTGRDLLGTWSIFEGAQGVANSIWGMLGFDTAAKGVRHLGAVYDIPPASFPNDCQMQLVTHVSEPSKDPVTTLPIVGDLFKHVDESRRKPETIVLIQPHIIRDAE